MNMLITGSNGYIGEKLYIELVSSKDRSPIPVMRRYNGKFKKPIYVESINAQTQWKNHLIDIDVVIHLAARAHILNETATDPLVVFRETNTAGTLNLASQSAKLGIRRFIFISSIGVNGNQTFDKPFTAADTPNPAESYAISKHEAEVGLRQIAAETDMEVVIIRSPLVYGANAPGNFGRLIHTVARGIPFPLGAIHNQRSLIALDNLIDLITRCIDHPAAANQTFLVSDGEDLSTTQLLQRLGAALDKPVRLLPIPQKLLETSLILLGKRAIAQRLCGNLQIDMSKTQELLNWTPPVSVDKALHQTAKAYLLSRKNT